MPANSGLSPKTEKQGSPQDTVIISDTTCLIGLTNIGRLDILRKIYRSVLVTPEVAEEYGNPLPEWITIQAVSDHTKIIAFNQFIDLGEASAIALALEAMNAVLIVDDRRARQFALGLGLEITGTLGVLFRAYDSGIIQDIDALVSDLRKNDFRLPDKTEELIKAIKN
jgi:predicted nucleic acid-binding protein